MLATYLTLTIRRLPDASLYSDVRVKSDGNAAEAVLAVNVPVALDTGALLALMSDPTVYGRILSQQLFASQAIRDAWLKVRGHTASGSLQLRINLDPTADDLHNIRWETLRDPETDRPIAMHERVRLVRTLDSANLKPIVIPLQPDLRALVVVSNPSNLDTFQLAEVDVEGEIGRARAALGTISTTILGDHTAAAGRATLANLMTQLRSGIHIVILVAHGTLRSAQPVLWLEQANGTVDHVSGADFVAAVDELLTHPLLLVLASCRSAGIGYSDTLSALGPGLARAGIPAVVGFQGDVTMATVKTFLPTLITELGDDGQIDRALAVARTALGDKRPWWQAVLWLRTDGRLWYGQADATEEGDIDRVLPGLPRPSMPDPPRLQVNPFTPGTITPPTRFFGRTNEIEMILSSIQGMQSISIVGDARIGKSSLLIFLAERIPHLLAPYGRYRPIYLSMDRMRDPGRLCHALISALLPYIPAGVGEERGLRRIEDTLIRGESPSLETTERIIGLATGAGVRIVLLLDEFKELLTHHEQFDAIFCGWLRSLYTQRQVALVMATRQPLREIEELSLYFLNGLSGAHTLGPLLPAEAQALLSQPHDRTFSAAELRIGLTASDNHPYSLQVAGDRLYRWKGQRTSPIHIEDGSLRDAADRILCREVQEAFDNAQALSQPRPARRSWWRWLDGLGAAAGYVGDSANKAGSRIVGAFIVLALLVIAGALIAFIGGWIDVTTFRDLLHTLSGDS